MGNAQTLTYHFGISHKVVFHHLKSFLNGNSIFIIYELFFMGFIFEFDQELLNWLMQVT